MSDKPICEKCWGKIKLNPPPFCMKCGKSLPAASQDLAKTCEECQKRKYSFDRVWNVCLYEGVMRECIHLLKYGKKLSLVGSLSQLIIDFASYFLDTNSIDIIIPVPLHRTKLREREFNQTYLLSLPFAKKHEIQISTNNLQRIKSTVPQSNLTIQERLKNVEGAFRIKNPNLFFKKAVLLIDDVFTTGSTVNECSKVLSEAGAKRIDVLTLARGN